MLFNSVSFALFFPIVVMLYFIIPHKYRWVFLLGASYWFYMSWRVEYIILIIASTLIDYFAGIQMGKTDDRGKRRKYLLLSLITNLGLLFAFKYFNFFNDSVRQMFNMFSLTYYVPASKLLLPVGISFYTFQTLSYTIDVYKGKKEPEKHLGIFALYVSFFPQLVAGPIERSTRLLPQFYEKKEVNYERITDGLKLMLWGYFKKLVIADRVAVIVNQVYNNPHQYEGMPFIIATIFFAFQIYCDFSGYSDIAIGSAQVLGYKLMDNFNRPYYSKSIGEFWKRWHISLSTWFKDYVYIPLGGNRVPKWRQYINLFVTFLVSGLWHGANWTFVIWGGLNGFYVTMENLTASIRHKLEKSFRVKQYRKLYNTLRILFTFILTCFAWIFFRANSLSDAFYIIGHMFTATGPFFTSLFSFKLKAFASLFEFTNLPADEILLSFISIGFMEIVHMMQRHGSIRHMLRDKPVYLRWGLTYVLILYILIFGVFYGTGFIYFQF